jgi:uncharacterized membrane protein YeaQ/YmgE (transglycosylase-associated protein family)
MMAFHISEYDINTFIWCAVGGALGWLAGLLTPGAGRILMVESVLVGIFGAFIGGDFIVAMVTSGVVDPTIFSVRSLALAIAGAVVMLILLRLMRRAVGPLRTGKAKPRRS